MTERFGTRVYDVGIAPIDFGALKSCRMGLLRMINKESYHLEKEVDPAKISRKKDEIKRLRLIRRDIKKLEKLV